MSLSFTTISSVGSNGAIIHYSPKPETDRTLNMQEIYLCDSGGQYRWVASCYQAKPVISGTNRGIANGGGGPCTLKLWKGEKKIGKGKKGKRKGKRRKERKEREGKGKTQRKIKGKKKRRERERKREGEKIKKRKERGINTVLIKIKTILTWIF